MAALAWGLSACALPVALGPEAQASGAPSAADGRLGSAWSSGPTEASGGLGGGPQGPAAATGATPGDAAAAPPTGTTPWRSVASPAGLKVEARGLLLSPAASTAQEEVHLRGEAFLVPTPDGGAWLLWNVAHPVADARDWACRIQRLDAQLNPVGQPLVGPEDFLVAAVCALPGGGFGLLGDRRKPGAKGPSRPPTTDWSERYDCEAWCFRFDGQGRERQRTFLLGEGRISDFDATARDDTNPQLLAVGEVLHAYVPVAHNYAAPGAPPDRHQSDWYGRVDAQGRLLRSEADFGFASHSSGLQLALTPQGPATLTAGDGGPFGLVLHFPDGSDPLPKVVWQPEGEEEARAVHGFHTHSAGFPGGLNFLAGSLWLSFNGGERIEPFAVGDHKPPLTQAPMLLELKPDGSRGLVLPLDAPAKDDEHVPSAPLGPSGLLVAWGSLYHPEYQGNAGPSLAVFDPQAKALSVPAFRAPGLPFSNRSPWATLSDGSVAWAVVQSPHLDQAQLVRVRRSP